MIVVVVIIITTVIVPIVVSYIKSHTAKIKIYTTKCVSAGQDTAKKE